MKKDWSETEVYGQEYLKGLVSVLRTVVGFIIGCKSLSLFPFFDRPVVNNAHQTEQDRLRKLTLHVGNM